MRLKKFSKIIMLLAVTVVGGGAQADQQVDQVEVERLTHYIKEQDQVVAGKIDFASYIKLAKEAETFRAKRLINLDDFLTKAKEPNTVILDSRSQPMFERKHIRGAIHLDFADYNQINLYQLIPDKNTTILIYCNNNFNDDQQNFASKIAVESKDIAGKPSYVKDITLALNVPTFINLYGYGYRNIYELADLVSTQDPRLIFEGSAVDDLTHPIKYSAQ